MVWEVFSSFLGFSGWVLRNQTFTASSIQGTKNAIPVDFTNQWVR
jgi:hypothetical protein